MGLTEAPAALVENRSRLVDHGERELRALALDLAEEALAALSPAAGLHRSVLRAGEELVVSGRRYDLSAFERIVVLGAGKASAELAIALEQLLGAYLSDGLVVVRRRPGIAPERVALMEAGHPVPTAASVAAGRALVEKAEGLGAKDLAICVFTGGSSALASLPPQGVSFADKTALHRLLLASGMSIVEINTVRKHVSGIKGGRLARAIAPARIVNLTVSDVVGDPLDCITDPTVADTSTVADALAVLEDHGLVQAVPGSIREHLLSATEAESPQLSDVDIETVLVTRGRHGSDAVMAAARSRGLVGVSLGALIEGEAATVGRVLATLARESRDHAGPWPRVAAMVACGGECTVTLGSGAADRFGKGGPSQEAAIAAALALVGVDGVVALFIDTDGSDGGTDVAGGLVDWSSELSARGKGISLRKVLAAHETKATLEVLGDAVVTGLTQTNVNDLAVILIR
jgi:glycerate-2-kinase